MLRKGINYLIALLWVVNKLMYTGQWDCCIPGRVHMHTQSACIDTSLAFLLSALHAIW